MTIFMFALSKPIKKHDANTTASTLWKNSRPRKPTKIKASVRTLVLMAPILSMTQPMTGMKNFAAVVNEIMVAPNIKAQSAPCSATKPHASDCAMFDQLLLKPPMLHMAPAAITAATNATESRAFL